MRFANWLMVALIFSVCMPFVSLATNFYPDRVFGDNNWVAVNTEASNIPLKYQKIVDAIGIMSVNCTATHIGNGYVLTAGHCMWAGPKVAEDLGCSDVTIRWGYRGSLHAVSESQCERIIIKQATKGIDYALLKVSPYPEAFVPVDLEVKPDIGSKVTIFSHPKLKPLRWSKLCKVNEPVVDSFDARHIFHECDTDTGSSGAALIDPKTMKVVGIHNGGYDSSTNYGTYLLENELEQALHKLF